MSKLEPREITIARINFGKTRQCSHKFQTKPYRIPKCEFKKVDCKICGKELARFYDQ